MKMYVRSVGNAGSQEVHATATPDLSRDAAGEAKAAFAAVADAAKQHGARICRERVFVPNGQLKIWQEARRAAYGDVAALAEPTWLLAGPSAPGGVQMHAIAGGQCTPLRQPGSGFGGWAIRKGEVQWAFVGGTSMPGADAPAQTSKAFAATEALLAQAGMTLHDVARTWFFLDDILSWYGPFNEVRTALFRERGLLRPGEQMDRLRVPASTGIGVTPAGGGRVGMEAVALTGPGAEIKRYAAAGKQRCAYEYGSAFARASEAPTPGGKSVYVSGTAAIDREGRTCHLDDAKAQTRMTIDCILALLKDADCGPQDAVQAMAYCKTPAIAAEFAASWQVELPWPWVLVVGDVCRDDLLFEAEVMCCKGSRQ